MRSKAMISLLTTVLTLTSGLLLEPALADAETNAVIGRLGLGCKNRVIEQFDAPNSDITVRLGATLQESLDSGAMTADDLKRDGASFDWSVSGKSASGYCNVDDKGHVTEFKQF